MFKTPVSLIVLAVILSGCHVRHTVATGPQPINQQPAPVYQQHAEAGVPPGHGGVPPGQGGVPPGLAKKGGVPPGLAKKGGVPPGLAKKGYRPVGWRYGAPPWYNHTHYGAGNRYQPPYGVYRSTCFREDLGTALGAVAGGVAGYQVGGGHGKTAAVIGGTIIGALIGGHIGRSMDDIDQNCVGQVLEHAPPNQPITWQNRDGRDRYEVTPSEAYQDRQGRYCREYQSTATIGGRPQQTYGTACRQPDGSWQIMN